MKNFVLLSFIVIIAFFFGCKKKSTPAPSSHTSGMGGMRGWHGTDQGATDNYGYGTSTAFSRSITDSFSLTIIDDSNIEILNNPGLGIDYCNFKLSATDPVAQTLKFGMTSASGHGYAFPREIIYYYAADSMTLTGYYGGIHGWEEIFLKTP